MVRLSLILISECDSLQSIFEKKFRSAFKGFIYKKLENSKFSLTNTNSNFRGFCFSNIFPIKKKKLKLNNIYHIEISSNFPELIFELVKKLEIGMKINLGEGGQFQLKDMNFNKFEIFSNLFLESVSPIIVKGNRKNNDFINFDIERDLYLKNLSVNLIKKYNFYNQKNIDLNFPLFESVEIRPLLQNNRKNSHFSILIEDFDEKRKGEPLYVYGNRLLFKFGNINDIQKEIFLTCVESGFGSMCSYGFGFMRAKKSD